MVEIYVREVVLGTNDSPKLLDGYKIFVRTRKHVIGYHPSNPPEFEGFNISYISKSEYDQLKHPKELLGRVFISKQKPFWVYTNASGVISIIPLPSGSWRDALLLSDMCKSPLPPSELMFMLELTSGR